MYQTVQPLDKVSLRGVHKLPRVTSFIHVRIDNISIFKKYNILTFVKIYHSSTCVRIFFISKVNKMHFLLIEIKNKLVDPHGEYRICG